MNDDEIKKSLAEGRKIAGRLKGEQEIANTAWAHFKSLHAVYTAMSTGLKQSLHSKAMSPQLFAIADALVRDTLSAECRIADQNGTDRLNLCKIADLLSQPEVQKEREQFFESLPMPCAHLCQDRVKFILSLVPPRWSKNPTLINDDRLFLLRDEFLPIRNESLAHAICSSQTDKVQIKRIDEFVVLTGELVAAAEWIFRGSTAGSTLPSRQKEAKEFWSYIPNGFRSH